MWTRKELKKKSKGAFKVNYWKSVFIAFILAFVVGTGTSGAQWIIRGGIGGASSTAEHSYSSQEYYDDFDMGGQYSEGYDVDADEIMNNMEADFHDILDQADALAGDTGSYTDVSDEFENRMAELLITFGALFVIVILAIIVIAIILNIFIINPLEVGSRRFFFKNLNQEAEVKEIAYGYDHSCKNVVKVMFFRDLYIILWSLLLIIPGIVKSYEYRMIPYLLAEYPDMPKEDAFAITKYMMKGNKWRAFVLDLSFILWEFLSAITLGIAGIFYVNPYVAQTHAALYEALKNEKRPFERDEVPEYPTAPTEFAAPSESEFAAPSESDFAAPAADSVAENSETNGWQSVNIDK